MSDETTTTTTTTPEGNKPYRLITMLSGALTTAFFVSGACDKVYAHFFPESAAMPGNVNDTFTLENLARLTVDDLSKVVTMNLLLSFLIPQPENVPLRTKMKKFAAPLAAFNILGIINHLIKFSEPDTYTKELLRVINAISAAGLFDYINGTTMPPAMFIQMITILFLKQNGGDVSSLIQEFLDGYVANLDSDTAARVTGVLSDLIAEVILPPAIGAATGLAAAAAPAVASSMKQTAEKVGSAACSIGRACYGLFGGAAGENESLLPGPGPSAPTLQRQ